MSARGFDNLRPEAHADEAMRHIHAITALATLNLENLYEPIRELGSSALCVFYFLYVSQTSASAEEIARFMKMPPRSARGGLKRCRERGYVEADPVHVGMWRVVARFCRNT